MFHERQPPLILMPDLLQSSEVVQPAIPASHIQGAYCGSSFEFGAPEV